MSWNAFLEIMNTPTAMWIVGVSTSALAVWLVIFIFRKNALKRHMKAAESRYLSIKSLPLPFKINKTLALAKVKDDVFVLANDLKNEFDQIQDYFKRVAGLLGECEDAILTNRLAVAKSDMSELIGILGTLESDAQTLNSKLDEVLKDESQQRSQITELKEQFRNIKGLFGQRSPQLASSVGLLQQRIEDLERAFSMFEDWMVASEFVKAKEKVTQIETELAELSELIQHLPDLFALAKGIIPKQIDEINLLYQQLKNDNVYVVHLEVKKNVDLVSEATREDVANLNRCIIKQVPEHLKENTTRLTQLMDQLRKEQHSHNDLLHALTHANDRIKAGQGLADRLLALTRKEAKRLGIVEMNHALTEHKDLLLRYEEDQVRMIRLFESRTMPSSALLVSVKDLIQDISITVDRLNQLKASVESAKSDEERATKQLMKLYLIMNEVQVKIRKYKLPNISSAYDGDIAKGYAIIQTIDKLLNESPLNIAILNSTVNEAIDVVYRLYNNVNNLVGTVEMIENAVVYANKYRPYHADLDAQMTRVELLFRNGDFTAAIKLALSAVESIQPTHYDTLIKENAQSVQP
jgi:septation ring formation regulator